MEITTKYITADDYKVYFNEDLEKKLKDGDNPSNKVSSFLMRVENDVALWLYANYKVYPEEAYCGLNDFQKQQYQLALLEQAHYMFKNGDIGNDSGYDQDGGVKASRENIKRIMISPRAELYLGRTGLCDLYM